MRSSQSGKSNLRPESERRSLSSQPSSAGLRKLALKPPYPPMEPLPTTELPSGSEWQFEPKWDGFRCLTFREGSTVELQSKAGQPLTRYFPEVVRAFQALSPTKFVLDGEIVIPIEGDLSFDDLLLRRRRSKLEQFAEHHFDRAERIRLSPATFDFQ
ncbi:MAG: hypothetical protein ACRD2B_03130, partial [Terriglobia bacterium]